MFNSWYKNIIYKSSHEQAHARHFGVPERELKFRDDIQVLRGVAILTVLIYHAKLGVFLSGYFGVDIFFVISGFLITSLIVTRIEHGSFSFSDFYVRRAKRLLPAAYTTFFIVVSLAPLFLTSSELRDLQTQLIGALTFTGNIVLWRQTGYFAGEAEMKPLLHVWSLSIEEQYYLIMPAFLFFVPKRAWRTVVIVALLLSLGVFCVLSTYKATAAFYLLPTRAWELALGSVGALTRLGVRGYRLMSFLFWPAVLAVLVVPALPIELIPWSLSALAVCVATLVIILRNHPFLAGSRALLPLGYLGAISYSLYLVHWPLFAFMNNIWLGNIPTHYSLVGVLCSIFLATIMYRFVEKPFHRMPNPPAKRVAVAGVAGAMSVVVVLLWSPLSVNGNEDFAFMRRGNQGFGNVCDYKSEFVPRPSCRSSAQPRVMVWGDSFAMHLIPGIDETSDLGTIQATKSVCGPILGMAPFYRQGIKSRTYNRSWAENCIAFNTAVLAYLERTTSIEYVVISSSLNQYVDAGRMILDRTADGRETERDPSVDLALDGIKRTVDAVRALGRKIVIVGVPPTATFNIAMCLERRASNMIAFGVPANCEIPRDAFEQEADSVLNLLRRAPNFADVEVIRLDSYLCGTTSCRTIENGIFLYRDSGHLSYDGSKILADEMNLSNLIQRLAR